MKKVLNTAVTVISWLVLLFVFSSIGFATSNPVAGVPLYMLFFIVVFAGVYFYVSRQKHTQENVVSKNVIVPRIIGGVILLAAVLMPWFVYAEINLNPSVYFIITAINIVMIAIAFFTIRFMNKNAGNMAVKILGYLILIALSAVPALAALNFFIEFFNRTYDALGTAYWCFLGVAVLSWWGFSLLGKKK